MNNVTVGTWEAVLIGVLVVVVLLWFGPGVRESIKKTPRGSWEDWKGVVIPLGLVILFVFLLLSMA